MPTPACSATAEIGAPGSATNTARAASKISWSLRAACARRPPRGTDVVSLMGQAYHRNESFCSANTRGPCQTRGGQAQPEPTEERAILDDPAPLATEQFCYLTTTGRVTGRLPLTWTTGGPACPERWRQEGPGGSVQPCGSGPRPRLTRHCPGCARPSSASAPWPRWRASEPAPPAGRCA